LQHSTIPEILRVCIPGCEGLEKHSETELVVKVIRQIDLIREPCLLDKVNPQFRATIVEGHANARPLQGSLDG
jgi:carbon monoxide dehydrogenase subunit G